MQVKRITQATPELLAGLAGLIHELNPAKPAPTADWLAPLLANSDAYLLVAEDETTHAILGTCTLAVVTSPEKRKGFLEALVVDETARSRGVGGALVQEALRLARQAGADDLHLTSSPKRQAANRLYQRLGFARRDTNVYAYGFDDEPKA